MALSRNMTKKQVVAIFREAWRQETLGTQWWGDAIAKREAFNDYVDSLNKEGRVTDWQAYNWSNPF
ncbi:hypothetical protein PTIM40_81 [Cyanophage P-TIM40]|uniref:Uncharacterized protein n=1 Tax=Cyanophage P-TIM40 TaxID=1589733 RepID=A0A0C5AIQ6_9CAUD|nr:hypothetical protein [Nonlabens xiamenensis]YP_009188156.1 hypothetical protein AU107_gp081 [Cyanophage P-TIM40]AJK27508.1 hypothetical protein PTIM40_81 [Cyanophage P-TIM40]|tara:strand:- start:31269 stop:31466 length:198 start_codon:yes stop_codon:yes gene_type:complete